MMASLNGHKEIVRTLLECRADVNAKSNVMNQMTMIVDNDDDDHDYYNDCTNYHDDDECYKYKSLSSYHAFHTSHSTCICIYDV